jgi:hypothetical protein
VHENLFWLLIAFDKGSNEAIALGGVEPFRYSLMPLGSLSWSSCGLNWGLRLSHETRQSVLCNALGNAVAWREMQPCF